jgi:hypothetical protein
VADLVAALRRATNCTPQPPAQEFLPSLSCSTRPTG